MLRNGVFALNFQTPALVQSQLTLAHGRAWLGRVTALCFVPYPGLLSAEDIDRYADTFERSDSNLVLVASGARPFHRLWPASSSTPFAVVLADPCARLHRKFGVAVTAPSQRCTTFVVDADGRLRLRISHEFVADDMDVLRRVVSLNRALMAADVPRDTPAAAHPAVYAQSR